MTEPRAPGDAPAITIDVPRSRTSSHVAIGAGAFLSASFAIVVATDARLTPLTTFVFSTPVVLGLALVALGLRWRGVRESLVVDADALRVVRRGRVVSEHPRAAIRGVEAGRSDGRKGAPSRVVRVVTDRGPVELASHLDAPAQAALVAALRDALAAPR